MNFYFISPIGKKSDYLYDTFIPTFERLGHKIVSDIQLAECVFYDLWCGWGEYDKGEIEATIKNELPVVVFDFFDYSDRVHWHGWHNWDAVTNQNWASNLKRFIDRDLVKVYFMRKIHRHLEYPTFVHPIECVLYPTHYFELVSEEELFNRPNDIFFIGNTSKERESVCNELAKHFKCDFILGQERIPHDEWLRRARNAKMFLTADGGGWSDERPYQLINIAAMLRQNNNHKQLHEFHDMVFSVNISKNPTSADILNIENVLSLSKLLYYIYISGATYMKEHYSSIARANYVLETVLENVMAE
jgi:hypothetical protein